MFQEPYLSTQNDENLHIFILILYTAFRNGKIIFVKICDKMTVFIQNLQETRMNTSKIIWIGKAIVTFALFFALFFTLIMLTKFSTSPLSA